MQTLAQTHAVLNQPPPLVPYDAFGADLALAEALEHEGGAWGVERLREAGAVAGGAAALEHAERCERNEPRLVTHDRYGNRVDRVELDPSWHWLLDRAIERELHALPWRDPRPGAQVVRAALFMLWSQVDAGLMCPISMTHSAVPALRQAPPLAEAWEPRLTSAKPRSAALAGMAMTEKQGGSDVRANTTAAEPLGDGAYELTGHKWFCSYPPCDIFLVLAQAPAGLSCFLVEGRDPGFRIQRLKHKLGTRSLPSSEIELHGVHGLLVGDEGGGVPAILRMVNGTRLDCLLGSAGSMRQGTAQAVHHARHRVAFGRALADQPLMRNVLADLALESEAATAAALRVARAHDQDEAPFRRLATATLKYWVCKRAPLHAAEALECLGGNGYVEESGLPRLYRDSPLNSIWEGSGNVAALDVLRVVARDGEALPAYLAECRLAAGADRRLDVHLDRLERALAEPPDADAPDWAARRLAEDLALALQASLLARHAPPAVSDAFCAGRLGDGGRALGTLPAGVDAAALVERALAA